MKNLIITGAYGFLGAALIKHFLVSNHYKITILVKSNTNNYRISDDDLRKLNIIYVDKTEYKHKLHDIKSPIIFHAANDYGRDKSLTQILSTNLVFPLELIEHVTPRIFINFDSYFNKNNSNYSYLGNYILSKKLLEISLENFKKIKIVNLKLEHLYGPNDGENKFISQLIMALKKAKSYNTTEGIQKRDFLYIDDLIKLVEEIVEKQSLFQNKYHHFEVGTGKSICVKDFIIEAKNIFNSQTAICFGALPVRENEIMDSFADLDLLPNFLNWKPCTNIQKGLNFIKELENEN